MNVNVVQSFNIVGFLSILLIYVLSFMLNDGISVGIKHIIAGIAFVSYTILQFVSNLMLTKSISGSYDVGNAISGMYPVLFLFGFYLLLQIFPGWYSVFNNTIGLLFLNMMGINTLFNGPNGGGGGLLKQTNDSLLINRIYGNNVNFLNKVNDPNYNLFDKECYLSQIRKMTDVFNTNPALLEQFGTLMKRRHIVSEVMWLLVIGITFSVSSCIMLITGMKHDDSGGIIDYREETGETGESEETYENNAKTADTEDAENE